MGLTIAQFTTVVASVLLIGCLVCTVYAQATFKWWEITTNVASTEYYFGLYRFCREDAAGEVCYRFDKIGMNALMNDTIGADETKKLKELPAENGDSKTVWILSFFYVVFLGIATFVSLFIVAQSVAGKTMYITFIIQSVVTVIAVIIGVACIAYGALRKDEIFEEGVKFLNTQGATTTTVKFRGFSFVLQLISVCVLVLPFSLYMLLTIPARRAYNVKKGEQ